MKNLIRTTFVVLFLLSMFTSIYAENTPNKKSNVSNEAIEKTLLIGLNSDNLGLKISSAYMLGEIKSKNAIAELTTFIKNVDNDKARLTAILALLKIASSESNVALNQNENNSEISQLCERLMNCHSCLTEIYDPQKEIEEVSIVSE